MQHSAHASRFHPLGRNFPATKFSSTYRGRCKYKSGKCTNERTTKENGEPHTLCEPHRLQHNKNQRKSDVKRRRQKRSERDKGEIMSTAVTVQVKSEKKDYRDETSTGDDFLPNELPIETVMELASWEPTTIHSNEDQKTDSSKWDEWSNEDIFILGEMVGLHREKAR